MKFTKTLPGIFMLIIFFSIISFAQNNEMQKKDMMKKEINKKEMMNNEMKSDDMMHKEMMMKIDKNMNGLALKGYDPVSYFIDMKPEMGMSKYKYEWMEAQWQFASKEHMDMFMKNPEKYAPQFGGYCAYGAGRDKLISGDPNEWTIQNGKLYLNVNAKVRKLFKQNLKKNIEMAEKNWPELSKKK